MSQSPISRDERARPSQPLTLDIKSDILSLSFKGKDYGLLNRECGFDSRKRHTPLATEK